MSKRNNWEEVPITDLFRLKQGTYLEPGEMSVTQDGAHPYPVYGANGVIGYAGQKMYSQRTALVSCRGANCGVVHFTAPNAWVSNNSIACVPIAEVGVTFYYYVFLNTPFSDVIGGSAQPQITISSLSTKRFIRPPLPIQRKIGAILSAYDDLIENNTRRIKILEEMAQMIYREWFANLRFPGHENVKMVESELPEGWTIKTLKEIAGVNRLSIKKGQEPSEIKYITISSVSNGQILSIEQMLFSKAPGRARRIVKHGDIIWSAVRPNLRAYSLILDPVPNLIVSTGFGVITPTKVPFSYLYEALTTDDFVDYLVNHTRGAAYPAVNTEDFENAKILVPDQHLLNSYHQIVSDLFMLRQSMFEKSTNLRCTRDLLLPKLMSGEVDVSELDIDTEGLGNENL